MPTNLETRIAILEQQVAQLQARQGNGSAYDKGWLEDVCGAFAGDELFQEAMDLGRQYRKSTRPSPIKRKSKR